MELARCTKPANQNGAELSDASSECSCEDCLLYGDCSNKMAPEHVPPLPLNAQAPQNASPAKVPQNASPDQLPLNAQVPQNVSPAKVPRPTNGNEMRLSKQAKSVTR